MTERAAKRTGAGLSADEFSAAVSAVTSAFGDPTRRDIYLFVRAGADGVTAHAEASGGSLTIVSEQCPFGDAAKKYPHVVCSVDRGMIRGMLAGLYGETRPLFTESRPAGDDHCVARV